MILLTGATGLLGHYLTEALLAAGHPLRLLVRNPEQSPQLRASGRVEVAEGHILDSLALEQALSGVSAVVHAAGLVSFHRQDRSRVMQVNAGGTARMVDACLMAGVPRFIHLSSVSAIGPALKGQPATEQTAWQEGKVESTYARSKRRAELEVYRGIAEGLEAAILNPSVVLGYAGDWERSSARLFATAARGLRVYLDGYTSLVAAEDVAAAVVALLATDPFPSGERYVLAAASWPTQQVLSRMAAAAAAAGGAGPTTRLPGWLALTAAWLSERLLGRRSALTVEAIRAGLSTQTYDGSKATQLGLAYTPPEEAIARLAKLWQQTT